MMIKLNGKQYLLNFTYTSIYFLEVAFGKPFDEMLREETPFNQQIITAWAMLANEPDFKNMDIIGISEVVQKSIEDGELTIDEFFDKINKTYTESIIIKQIFNLDESSPPSGSGGQERASEKPIRRNTFSKYLSRLKHSCRAFLEEFTKGI